MNAAPAERRTVVVHTKLAGHIARVAAARADENGVQIMTMGQLAARLAGGLLRPIDPETLRDALREALPAVAMGELEPMWVFSILVVQYCQTTQRPRQSAAGRLRKTQRVHDATADE